MILWDNLCYNWLEPKIKPIGSYSNIYNKASLTCKLIQELYNNSLHQPINVILIIFLPAYQYMMEAIGKVSSLCLECLEAAFFYIGRNFKTQALGRSAGPVQNVIMALPNARFWKAIREELKRCFSDQTSLGHADVQLENMTQKLNEPLRLYIFRYSKFISL